MTETVSVFSVVATPPSIAADPEVHRARGFAFGATLVHYPMSHVHLTMEGAPVEGLTLSTRYAYGGTPGNTGELLNNSWRLGFHGRDTDHLLVLAPGRAETEPGIALRLGQFLSTVGALTPRRGAWTHALALGMRLPTPRGFPNDLRNDLLFLTYAIAPLLVRTRWSESAVWSTWVARWSPDNIVGFSYRNRWDPESLFTKDELASAEVSLLTDLERNTHVILRTKHRQFWSAQPLKTHRPAGVVRERWDGTWSGHLLDACQHPFLMVSEGVPAQLSVLALGPEVESIQTETEQLLALFVPVTRALPRVMGFLERGTSAEAIATRLVAEPGFQGASADSLRWLLVGTVNLCQDAARLWPTWTALFGSPQHPLVNRAETPEA